MGRGKRITSPIQAPREDADWAIGRAAFEAHRASRTRALPEDVVDRLWAKKDGPFVAYWIAIGKEELRQRRERDG